MHKSLKTSLLLGLTGVVFALAIGTADAVDTAKSWRSAGFWSENQGTPSVSLYVGATISSTTPTSSPGTWGHRAEQLCTNGASKFGPWRTSPTTAQTSTTPACTSSEQFTWAGRAWFRTP